jgi:hypothetical protein
MLKKFLMVSILATAGLCVAQENGVANQAIRSVASRRPLRPLSSLCAALAISRAVLCGTRLQSGISKNG